MNKKILLAGLAALLLASGPVRADDKPASAKDSIMTFFRNLKNSLAQSAVQGERKKTHGAAVAAVRGASQASSLADPNETSLKGDVKSRKAKADAAEDAEIEKAVDLILKGKPDEGVKALEDFKAKHPKSHNLEKVQQAIDQAKGLSAAAPADGDKDEAKPADKN